MHEQVRTYTHTHTCSCANTHTYHCFVCFSTPQFMNNGWNFTFDIDLKVGKLKKQLWLPLVTFFWPTDHTPNITDKYAQKHAQQGIEEREKKK